MYSPSGDHVGLLMNHRFSREICFAILPVALDRPDVPQAVAVAGDRDALAVGAEARLHVEGGAARQPRRRRAPLPSIGMM